MQDVIENKKFKVPSHNISQIISLFLEKPQSDLLAYALKGIPLLHPFLFLHGVLHNNIVGRAWQLVQKLNRTLYPAL